MSDPQQTSQSSELQQVQKVWDRMKNRSPVYEFFLSEIQLCSAAEKTLIARLTVRKNHLNSKGSMHGTVSACLIDWAGGMAIASTGLDSTGVSTDIHTTFVSTAKEGDLLEIEAKASKVGRTLAFTTVEIKKIGDDGTRSVVSTGSHTKYVKQ